MQRAVGSVQCAIGSMQCTLYSVRYSINNGHEDVSSQSHPAIRCPDDVLALGTSAQYLVYSIQCAGSNTLYLVYSVYLTYLIKDNYSSSVFKFFKKFSLNIQLVFCKLILFFYSFI